jgi:hypothetical protein
MPVTFNNGGADIEPLAQNSGSTTSLTIPANTGSAGQFVTAYSDWMPLPPLARIDGGEGALLLVRCYSASGTMRYAGSLGSSPDPVTGIVSASYWSTGNGAESSWTFTAQSFQFGSGPCGVQSISGSVGATVASVGDSIFESLHTTGTCSGFGLRAVAEASSSILPISFYNLGYAGQVSSDYIANGLWALNSLKPQVMIIQGISENDLDASNTLAVAQLCVQRALALADQCLKNGCWPILTTAAPWGGAEPGLEANRVAANIMIRAAAAQGFDMLDIDALWGVGSNPVQYISGYCFTDLKHPTDMACAVAAQFLVPMIQRALGLA